MESVVKAACISVLVGVSLLGGCDELRERWRANAESEVRLNHIVASNCDAICQTVTIEFVVENNDDIELCVPQTFTSERIVQSLIFKSGDSDEWLPANQPFDPNPVMSAEYGEAMKDLAREGQTFIDPGSEKVFSIVLENKYDLTPAYLNAKLRVGTFACPGEGARRDTLRVYDLSHRVQFR